MMSISTPEMSMSILEEARVALSKCVAALQLFADPRFARFGKAQGWSRVAVHLPVCFQLASIRTVACDSSFV